MNSKKFFFVMVGGISILIILGLATVVFGNNMLQQKSDELTELKLENRVLDEQQIALLQASKDIKEYEELESIAKTVVPQDKDQARTVRELVKLAQESGISISGISFPQSALGDGKRPGDGSSLTQVKPVKGIDGVYELPVTLELANSATTYDRLIGFLHKLEQNRRTSQVNSLDIRPDPKNRDLLTFNLTLSVYIKP